MAVKSNQRFHKSRFVRNLPLLLAIHVVALILIRTVINANDCKSMGGSNAILPEIRSY